MFLSKPKKKGEKDPFAGQYTEVPDLEMVEIRREVPNLSAQRGAAAMQRLQENIEGNPLAPSEELQLSRLNNNLTSAPTMPSYEQVPTRKNLDLNMAQVPTQAEQIRLDPLTKAQYEVGERKSPGFWGRLGQGARAFLTGDGIGGFVLGLGDTYGKAAHQDRIQELAGQYAAQDAIEQQGIQNQLALRKQAEAERFNDARIQDYESRDRDRASRIDFLDQQLKSNREVSDLKLQQREKEFESKAADMQQRINLEKAQRLMAIMKGSGQPNPAIAAELTQILDTELPPELSMPLANQFGVFKGADGMYTVNKYTGETKKALDANTGQQIKVFVNAGGGRGGGDPLSKGWREIRETLQPDINTPEGRKAAIQSKIFGTRGKQIPYWIHPSGIKVPQYDENGNYLSPEESMVREMQKKKQLTVK